MLCNVPALGKRFIVPPVSPILKKTLPKPLNKGNALRYYVPAVKNTKPAPPVPATGAKKTVKAFQFFKAKFKEVRRSPFGPMSPLPARKVMRDIEVIQAALECGYGKRVDWTAMLVLNSKEAQELTNYLVARLGMLLACIRVDGKDARALREFYKKMESSEKTAISFLAGSIGAYIAARLWLKAAGERMEAFLHVGIYTKSIAGNASLVSYFSAANKWPDYLVKSASGQWHVFESKGGAKRSRWQRLAEGLHQLQGMPHIGWAGQPAVPATSVVCVHTSVDAGKDMQLTVVDPPPDDTLPSERQPLEIIAPVVTLMKFLETVQQFRSLTDTAVDSQVDGSDVWVEQDSRQFQGVRIGLPRKFLLHEEKIRVQLGLFIAVRDALEAEDSGSERFNVALDRRLSGVAKVSRGTTERNNVEALVFLSKDRAATLDAVGNMLGLYRLSEDVKAIVKEAADTFFEDDENAVLTTGGLRLQSVGWRDSSRELDKNGERPRA